LLCLCGEPQPLMSPAMQHRIVAFVTRRRNPIIFSVFNSFPPGESGTPRERERLCSFAILERPENRADLPALGE
jgi:hypothetical protein